MTPATTHVPASGPLSVAEAFNSRANSIGFLRWFLAFLVLFSHAGPLGGFYHSHDLRLTPEQSLGGMAVAGFFFFSGFLITRSGARSSFTRFMWHRFLRIFPAFWAALLVTAFVFAPLAWHREHGTFSGYFAVSRESPLTYFWHNMWLDLSQRNIAGLGDHIPYGVIGGHDWNGSAWTLIYEFKGYLFVGLLALFGVLAHRWIATIAASAIIVVNAMTWTQTGNLSAISPLLADARNATLLAPFAAGILLALWAHRIPVDDRLMVLGLLLSVVSLRMGGWNIWGQYAACYVLLWFAIRVTFLRNWERFGDFSYGIYIFAWPLMQLAAYFGLYKHGWLAYHLTIILGVHLIAYASWHLIESPAMSLKGWSPRLPGSLGEWLQRSSTRVRRSLTDPRYSSTRLAAEMRGEQTREVAPPHPVHASAAAPDSRDATTAEVHA